MQSTAWSWSSQGPASPMLISDGEMHRLRPVMGVQETPDHQAVQMGLGAGGNGLCPG